MNRRAAVAVAIATCGFATALALRTRVDPWLATSAVAVGAIAVSGWAIRARAGALLHASWRAAAIAAALGVALVALTHVVYRAAGGLSPALAADVHALYASIASSHGRVALVVLTLVVVVAEELTWRGAAVELVGARSRPLVGAATVALYAVPQLFAGTWLLVVAALGLGAVFATQRLVSGRLVDAAITHAVWSVSIFVLVPLVAT